MEVRLGVTVFLGKTEINDIDLIPTLPNAHQEVVGFDIAVDEGFGMDVLNPGNELICKKQDSLQGEFAVAEVEEIFQTRSQKVEYHSIVVTFCSKPANKGNADSPC